MKEFVDKIWQNLVMNRQVLALAVFYAVSCGFYAHYLYNWDSGQFALATKYFSLEMHQPHAPGYPLTIFLTHILSFLTADFNLALIALNWLAGGAATILLYRSANLLTSSQNAWWVTLLFIVNPVFWLNHNGAMTYTFEVLGVSTSAYLLLRSLKQNDFRFLLINAVAGGLIIGLRPSFAVVFTMLFLAHLWIERRVGFKYCFIAILFFFLSVLSWFAPFMWLVGVENFLMSLGGQFGSVARTFASPAQLRFYLESLMLGFNFLLILILLAPQAFRRMRERQYYFIFLVTFASYLFYLLTHFGNVAYISSFLPLVFLLLIPFIELGWQRKNFIMTLTTLALIQIILFFVPVKYFVTKEVRLNNYAAFVEHDARVRSYVDLLRQYATSTDTLLVAVRGQYFDANMEIKSYLYDDIRVLGYYAPQAKIYDLIGTAGKYYIAHDYFHDELNLPATIFPAKAKRMFVLVDYLNPVTYPAGLGVKPKYLESNTANIYEFSLGGSDKFNLLGTDFVRARN